MMASPQQANSAQEQADPLHSDTQLPINDIVTLSPSNTKLWEEKSLSHNQSEMHVLLNCDWDARDLDFTSDRSDNFPIITLL